MHPTYNNKIIKPATISAAAIVLVATFLLSGCDIFSSDSDEEALDGVTYTIYNNINDPLLLSAVTAEGDSIAYYGERNQDGIPTKVTGAIVNMRNKIIETANGDFFIENETVEIVNHGLQNMPSQIITEEITFLFEWESPTEVVITSIENDGYHRTQIALDLNDINQDIGEKLFSEQKFTQRESINEMDQKSYPVPDFQSTNQLTEMGPVYSATQTTSQTITIDRCGYPLTGARLNLNIGGDPEVFGSGTNLTVLPPSDGSNRYIANVPVAGETAAGDLCESVIGAIGSGCGVANELKAGAAGICAQIAIGSGPLAPKIGPICLTAITGYAAYCAYAHWGPDGVPEGFDIPAPIDFICPAIQYIADRAIDPGVEDYRFWINHHILDKKGEARGPHVGALYEDLYLNLDGTPELNQLRADPPNPAEDQNYMILVQLNCATQGNVLGISIVGSDGYSDSTTCNQILDSNIDCTLLVPGAEGGVEDIITVTLDGSEIGTLRVVFRGGVNKITSTSKGRRQ